MEIAPTALLGIEPPAFPDSPSSVDLSPLEFVLALIAVVTIPALVYVFFFAVKCPPNPFRSRRYRSNSSETDGYSNVDGVADVIKVEKEGSHASKDVVGSECPVCLMVFAEGEEVKQLSVCKHSFHVPCIDLWLNSHSNCPVCRASVFVKQETRDPRVPFAPALIFPNAIFVTLIVASSASSTISLSKVLLA
ncbi:hypothetical protein ACJW30_09G005200 [Castanea mollissima]